MNDPTGFTSFEQWKQSGIRIEIRGNQVFIRYLALPNAPVITFLHGFPTSSWDFHKIAPALLDTHSLLFIDFVGFGDSDKPHDFNYSILEQAAVVEEVWRRLNIAATSIICHDFGTSVVQELLAKDQENGTRCKIERILFTNGALYPGLHRPLLIQKLLAHPLTGPLFTHLVTKKTFERNMRKVFFRPLDPSILQEFWRSVENRGGDRIYHKLIGYMRERARYGARWVTALEQTKIPLSFVWGMRDPVSGKHVLDTVRKRLPHAKYCLIEDAGHYPQLESADLVIEGIFKCWSEEV